MMKNLLIKEFKLSVHVTSYLFLAFGLMLLIPSYPYYVAFMYTCLAQFFMFLIGRENKDVFFTSILPIKKADAVKARCFSLCALQVLTVIISVPFAIIGTKINPNPSGNPVGIEANVAFYGFVFIMFALFNIIFIPGFYKTAYKTGVPLLFGGIAIGVYIIGMEVAVNIVPAMKKFLDTSDVQMQMKQLPILAAGLVIYFAIWFIAYKIAAKRFDKVDL